ncbi:MFS transporter [Virgisporangium aliadipatigenens]|uniref:MFS transporter n=1 Tax=Virgisporangium aliadipatigenens TaxID=741659 RepID=A0A8J3YHB5_9ACTN|nr:MFS transporter [Virgisporangium aliadipatigenens]GIJ43956.1 MFS transporter [Virgisporangium aliadipatigenens]
MVLARYLLVAALVRLADEGARVAIVLLAVDRTGDAALGGILVAALMIPHVVAAPLIGAYGDRTRRPRLFYTVALLTFASSLAGCALLVGGAPAWTAVVVVVLGGCCAPLATGGLSSLLKELVPAKRRPRAYSFDVLTYNTAGIVGPAFAALLAARIDARPAALVAAAVAACGALLVLTLPLRERVASGPRPPMAAGVVVLWTDPVLRAITFASSLGAIGIGVLPIAATVLATERTGDATDAGLLISAYAVGGLIGSLANARFTPWVERPQRLVIWGTLVGAVPLMCVPLGGGMPVAVVLFALSGFTTGPVASGQFGVRDRYAPAPVHTQVFTISAGIKVSSGAVGAAVAGATIGLGGAWLVLLFAGGKLFGALLGALLLRRAHRPAPEPAGVPHAA